MNTKTLLIAAAIVLLAGPAAAQMMSPSGIGSGGREMPDPNAAEKQQKAQELDDAYKSGLKSIPNQSQKKNDPWGNVRNAEPTTGRKATR